MYTCWDGEESMKTETNPRNPHIQTKKTQNNTETPKGTRPVSINATFFKGSLELSIKHCVSYLHVDYMTRH